MPTTNKNGVAASDARAAKVKRQADDKERIDRGAANHVAATKKKDEEQKIGEVDIRPYEIADAEKLQAVAKKEWTAFYRSTTIRRFKLGAILYYLQNKMAETGQRKKNVGFATWLAANAIPRRTAYDLIAFFKSENFGQKLPDETPKEPKTPEYKHAVIIGRINKALVTAAKAMKAHTSMSWSDIKTTLTLQVDAAIVSLSKAAPGTEADVIPRHQPKPTMNTPSPHAMVG